MIVNSAKDIFQDEEYDVELENEFIWMEAHDLVESLIKMRPTIN